MFKFSPPLSLYLHWPWCGSKCPYCDFASRVGYTEEKEKIWLDGCLQEMTHYAARLPYQTIISIFFGGGTPSMMKPQTAAALLDHAAKLWSFSPDIEVTLEANPSSLDRDHFPSFKNAGINRLSLGVQALDDDALRFLGRSHDRQTAEQAINLAAQYFDRFSFDLIYARAGQSLPSWRDEINHALSFAPKHLSLYQLTIEDGTLFGKRTRQGEKLSADDDLAADLYEMTQELLTEAGLPAYEISNHAAKGEESRHNMTYWRYGSYLGLGPSAHGRFNEDNAVIASLNHQDLTLWHKAVLEKGCGSLEAKKLSVAESQTEAVLMGLRLTEGLDLKTWQTIFGSDLFSFLDEAKCARLQEEKLIGSNEAFFFATPKGREKLNALLSFLLT